MPKAKPARRLSAAELRRLCDAPPADTPIGRRDRALLATLASSGCRVAEVVGLTTAQLRVDGPYIYIEIPAAKQLAARQAPLSREAYERIQAWLACRPVESRYVFTRFNGRGCSRAAAEPMSPTSAWRAVQRYAQQAGLGGVGTQAFRWFVGSELMRRRGVAEAQRALGLRRSEATHRYGAQAPQGGITDGFY